MIFRAESDSGHDSPPNRQKGKNNEKYKIGKNIEKNVHVGSMLGRCWAHGPYGPNTIKKSKRIETQHVWEKTPDKHNQNNPNA